MRNGFKQNDIKHLNYVLQLNVQQKLIQNEFACQLDKSGYQFVCTFTLSHNFVIAMNVLHALIKSQTIYFSLF